MACLARALKFIFQFSAVGAAYFLLARFWLELASAYPNTTAIWLPAGFALAAVLLGGYRMVLAILAAAYLANAVSSGPSYAVAATAAGHAIEAFGGGLLVNEWAGGREVFATPAGIAKFALLAVVVAAISPSVGASVDAIIGGGVSLGPDALARIQDIEWGKLAAVWVPA